MVENKILLGAILIFIVMLVLNIFIGTFSIISFFLVVFYMFIFIAYFFLLKYFHKVDEIKFDEKLKEKEDFSYCWKRINIQLDKLPGSDSITWDRGNGVYAVFKNYVINKESCPFLGLIARNQVSSNNVHIIYNVPKDKIVYFKDDPGSDSLLDPFYGFRPEENDSAIGTNAMYQNPYMRSRYGLKGMSGYDGYGSHNVNVNLGKDKDDDEQKKKDVEQIKDILKK